MSIWKASWAGYILDIDGKRTYIAGDTDATEEAKAVKCDIALVPIGGTYTMNAKEAAGRVKKEYILEFLQKNALGLLKYEKQ